MTFLERARRGLATRRRRLAVRVERYLPDRVVINRRFREVFGRNMDFKHPQTFNEKIQWMKLYHRDPLMSKLADKYEVREYVAATLGTEFLNEVYGVWDDARKVDFEKLPGQFVIKATHGSGWNLFCTDRASFDPAQARAQMAQWLASDHFYIWAREWCYKHIKPRVIGERLLSGDDGKLPADFKFYCFHGEPKLVEVHCDRFTQHKLNIYDMAWQLRNVWTSYPNLREPMAKPENLETMIQAARALSRTFPFCRTDFYSISGRVIFGEITFYPASGLDVFEESYDLELGRMLKVP